MTSEQRAAHSGLDAVLPVLVAAIPFVPSVREFIVRGIPDFLFTGDAAVLELGTWRAVHAVQLVGPYSRFGWSHPGPAYFYLAAPFYVLLGERGAALNLFALATACAAVFLIVVLAWRLRGIVFALLTASLIAAYVRVAAPFLVANEWNPILPICRLLRSASSALRALRGTCSRYLYWPSWVRRLFRRMSDTHRRFLPSPPRRGS